MKKLKDLNLREKIFQMFILGFEGESYDLLDKNIINAVNSGLGGIIYFCENIKSPAQIKNLIASFDKKALLPLFHSIDQEGGQVERTKYINNNEKFHYLSAMALGKTDVEDVIAHTNLMCSELNALGFNVNFAPVLDTNTNPLNPIIGIRAYANTPEDVIQYSIPVMQTLKKHNILAVGKHFPGHGDTCIDSHINMPKVNLSLNDFEKVHIEPFKQSIVNQIDALMISHVYYPAFTADKVIPASLSKEIITEYLIKKLNYTGLIISDDMEMGSVKNNYSHLKAFIKAINAGTDLIIFRYSNKDILNIIDKLELAVQNNEIAINRINESVEKIFKIKQKYKLFDKLKSIDSINIRQNQKIIDKIAKKSIKIIKNNDQFPINKNLKTLILSPDKKTITNLETDTLLLSDCLQIPILKEVQYSLEPTHEQIDNIITLSKTYEQFIFLSYNAHINKSQQDLIKNLNISVAISLATEHDSFLFSNANAIIVGYSYKQPSLKAIADILMNN